MITVKEATAIAIGHVAELFPGSTEVMLEEVELTADEKFWLITVSFRRVPNQPTLLMTAFRGEKEYKIIKVSSLDGKPLSIKIRQL